MPSIKMTLQFGADSSFTLDQIQKQKSKFWLRFQFRLIPENTWFLGGFGDLNLKNKQHPCHSHPNILVEG